LLLVVCDKLPSKRVFASLFEIKEVQRLHAEQSP
jgi:hypothetical protein